MRSDEVRDAIHKEGDALVDDRLSLVGALTEIRHNLNIATPIDGIFSLESTVEAPHVSEREIGINGAQVADYLRWPHAPWGVDYLALSFGVRSVNPEPPEPWREQISNGGEWSHKWSTSLPIGEGWVDVEVKKRFPGLVAYVWFNPTTCLYGPKSASIARLDDALYVTGEVLDAVMHWITPACSNEEMLLSRVDATLDVVHVSDVQRLLRLVRDAPGRGKAAKTEYAAGGLIQTVTKRAKTTGGYCVYNKGLQTGTDQNLVRFEVTARRRRLAQISPRLGDLTDESLRRIALNTLNPVLDYLTLTPTSPLDDILTDPTETKSLLEMLGIGLLQCLGHYPKVTTYMKTKKFLPLLRKYNARSVGDLIRRG